MSGTVQDVINVALAEVGYVEKKSNADLQDFTANAGSANYTKYGEWYGLNPAQWCAEFSSYCYAMAGLTGRAPKYCGCYSGIAWFRKYAQFHTRNGYIPKPGDAIFFSSTKYPNGGAHTGIVIGCDGKYVHTIEGNTSGGSTLIANGGCVAKKSYLLSYGPIYGYGTPNYMAEAIESEDNEMPMSGEEISVALKGYLSTLPTSEFAKVASEKGVESKAFCDGDHDNLVDDPKGYLTREEFAVVLYRLGLFDNTAKHPVQ